MLQCVHANNVLQLTLCAVQVENINYQPRTDSILITGPCTLLFFTGEPTNDALACTFLPGEMLLYITL